MTPRDNPPENDNPLAASDIGCYVPEALDEGLERARKDVSAPAVQNLLALADRALEDGPWSLVNKPDMPPTGSRHDYPAP